MGRPIQLQAPGYSDPKLYKGDFTIEVFEVDNESKERDCAKRKNVISHRIDQNDMAKGFAKMSKVFPRQFGQVVADDTLMLPAPTRSSHRMLFGDEKSA